MYAFFDAAGKLTRLAQPPQPRTEGFRSLVIPDGLCGYRKTVTQELLQPVQAGGSILRRDFFSGDRTSEVMGAKVLESGEPVPSGAYEEFRDGVRYAVAENPIWYEPQEVPREILLAASAHAAGSRSDLSQFTYEELSDLKYQFLLAEAEEDGYAAIVGVDDWIADEDFQVVSIRRGSRSPFQVKLYAQGEPTYRLRWMPPPSPSGEPASGQIVVKLTLPSASENILVKGSVVEGDGDPFVPFTLKVATTLGEEADWQDAAFDVPVTIEESDTVYIQMENVGATRCYVEWLAVLAK